jgi:t-SNARE complex subunit (syntaxin)
MLEPVGNLPFAIQIEKSRESIQNHQAQQQVQKEHQHKLEKVLERQKLDLMLSYDKFGARNTQLQPPGQVVDMEV